MSTAHVCDECKKVAVIDGAFGWWHVAAMVTLGTTYLNMAEKDEYEFCTWECLEKTAARLARVGVAS